MVKGELELGSQLLQELSNLGRVIDFSDPKVSSPVIGDNNSFGFLSCDHGIRNPAKALATGPGPQS